MAEISQFNGIQTYHEGMAVSDWVNVFPLKTVALDRLGEVLVDSNSGHVRGHFKDSHGNIYLVINDVVCIYNGWDSVNKVIGTKACLMARNGEVFHTLDKTDKVTFCESSTKPSQVYMCDGMYVYWWNTEPSNNEEMDKLAPWTLPFVVNMFYMPGMKPKYVRQVYNVDDIDPNIKLMSEKDIPIPYEGFAPLVFEKRMIPDGEGKFRMESDEEFAARKEEARKIGEERRNAYYAEWNKVIEENNAKYNRLKQHQIEDSWEMIQAELDPYDYKVHPEKYTPEVNAVWSRIGWDFEDMVEINQIAWFNNKLVGVQTDKNTVWMTATDPGMFYRYSSSKKLYIPMPDGSETVVQEYPVLATSQQPYWSNDSDTTVETNGVTANDRVWTYWVSSTNGSDKLREVVSFAGNLYFLNTASIEVWTATGIEDNPIASSTQSIIHFGGKAGLVVDNELYLVCNNQVGAQFISKIHAGGGIERISTAEIEQRLPHDIEELCLIRQRNHTFVAVQTSTIEGFYKHDVYAVTSYGTWFRWLNPEQAEFAVASIIDDLAVTRFGSLVRFDDESRSLLGNYPIARRIRDWFVNFTQRRILREVSLVLDTGKKVLNPKYKHNLDPSIQEGIYCAVSFDRGAHFSPRRFRRWGQYGTNDRVIVWRNLGSGNSICIEVGSSAMYKLQLYSVVITPQ